MKIDQKNIISRKKSPAQLPKSNAEISPESLNFSQIQTQQSHKQNTICLQIIEIQKKYESSISLRQKQINIMQQYLKEFSHSKKLMNRILLAVGSSGVGKSVTVDYMLKNNGSNFNVIQLSANIFSSVKEITKEINKLSASYLQNGQIFISEKDEQTGMILNKNKVTVIYIEQIEQIVQKNKNNNELIEFLSIFKAQTYGLLFRPILIATSNLIHIGQIICQKFRTSRQNGLRQVVFIPYQNHEFAQIIKEKIKQIQSQFCKCITIKDSSIYYIANKCTQNRKGDTRVIIEFIKKYLIKALVDVEQQTVEFNALQISRYIDDFFNPRKMLLEKLCKKCKMVVIGFYTYIKQKQSIFVSYQEGFKQCQQVFKNLSIKLQIYQYERILEQLQGYGVIKISSKKTKRNPKNSKIMMKIGLQQIEKVVASDSILKKFIN